MVSGLVSLEWLVWKNSLEGEAITTQIFHHHKHIKKKKKKREKRLWKRPEANPSGHTRLLSSLPTTGH